MREPEMALIGSWIARVIHDGRNSDGSPNEAVISEVRGQVEALCEAFPIYPSL
jgi:glycine/serine hydroxymethyltransferase